MSELIPVNLVRPRGPWLVLLCSLLIACGDMTPEEHIEEAKRILHESRDEIAMVRSSERKFAIAELKEALKQDGENLEASILLGMTLYQEGKLEDAEHWFSKALGFGGDPAELTPLRAEILLATGELDTLDSLSIDGLGPEGRSTVQAAKAVSLLKQEKPELAVETIEAAFQNEPYSIYAEVAAARVAMGVDGYDAAHEKLQDIVTRYPHYAPAWSLLGDVESARGQAAAALKAYRQYMQLAGPRLHALMNSALMLTYVGGARNAREARNTIRRAYDLSPRVRYLDSYNYIRGLTFVEMSDKQYEARKAFVREVSNVGAFPQSLYYLAALNLELGVIGLEPDSGELALSHAYEFLRYVPDSAAGARLAAKIELVRGKYKNAERLLRPVLRRQPDDTEALDLMARSLLGLDQVPEAIEVLTRLSELQPDSLVIKARLGAAYLGAGSRELAVPVSRELSLDEPDVDVTQKITEDDSAEQVLAKRLDEAEILDVETRLEPRDPVEGTDLLLRDDAPEPEIVDAGERRGTSDSQVDSEQFGMRVLQKILADYPGYEQADILLVLNHLRQRRIADAIEAAESYRARNPSGATPYLLLGRAYLADNNREKAKAAFLTAMELRPGDPDAGNGLADIAVLENRHDAARQHYKDILDRHPDHTKTWMGLVATFAAEGRGKEMLESLQEASGVDPRALGPRLATVRYHVARGELDEAVFLLRGFTKEEEKYPETLETMALTAVADGRYDHALVALQKLVQLRPDTAQYHYLLAKTYAGLGSNRRMMAELRRAVELAPGHFYAKLASARLEYLSGRHEAFDDLLSELREIAPDHPEVMRLEASSAEHKGDNAIARRLLETVYDRQPMSDNLVALAVHRHRLGETSGAIQSLQYWIKDHPDDVAARERLAEFYSRSGKVEQAVREYRKIVEIKPDHASALNNLAWHLLEHEPEDALEFAESALRYSEGSSAIYDTLAMAQLKNDKLLEARRSIGRARELDPENAELQLHEKKIMSAGRNEGG
jgi:tetratricopeptide (TPR) repeat protein